MMTFNLDVFAFFPIMCRTPFPVRESDLLSNRTGTC